VKTNKQLGLEKVPARANKNLKVIFILYGINDQLLHSFSSLNSFTTHKYLLQPVLLRSHCHTSENYLNIGFYIFKTAYICTE
jgi:hypothetical protein